MQITIWAGCWRAELNLFPLAIWQNALLIDHQVRRFKSADSDDNDDKSCDTNILMIYFFVHRSEFLLVCDRGHLASFAQVLALTKICQERYCQSNHDNITAIKSTKIMGKMQISDNFWGLHPQTIYFIAMVFGVMTFGILSDIVGRKKVGHTFTQTLFTPVMPVCQAYFLTQCLISGVDTFTGVYERLWNHHLLHEELKTIHNIFGDLGSKILTQKCSQITNI